MNTQMKKRIVSILLAVTLAVPQVYLPAKAAPAEAIDTDYENEPESDISEEGVSSDDDVTSEELSEENAILEESTENATVFDRGNGKRTVVFHSQDVRFEKDGELIDYDPALTEIEDSESGGGENLESYKYVNTEGDAKHFIPETLGEDSQLLMEKEDYAIKMLPLDQNIQGEMVTLESEETMTPYEEMEEKNTVAVYESKDEQYSYKYTSLEHGLKESIILNEKPESNVFTFSLNLKGMKAEVQEEENIILLKDKEEVVAILDKPFMNDATGEAYSEDIRYSLEEKDDGIYSVSLTASKKYLNSVERVYPVTIDPTATWKGEESFLDTYVISGDNAGKNYYKPENTVMPVGMVSSTKRRTYFKLPYIKAILKDKYVDSAYLTLYETSASAGNQSIRINRIVESFSVSTLTWNNRPEYYSAASVNTFTTDGDQYASHKIKMTTTIRNMVNSKNISNLGFVMRNITSNPGCSRFYGSRYSNAAYRPKLVVEYYDKPTALKTMEVSQLSNEEYIKTNYVQQGKSIYVSWTGVESKNLEAIQYKYVGVDGTEQPTSVSSDKIDLSSYRDIGTATANGTNVRTNYGASLPAGVYRLYLRGADAGGMYGNAKYRTVYVDGDTPALTNVTITPLTSSTAATTNCTPTLSWSASDTYFSKVTVAVDGKAAKTVTTVGGNGTYTLPDGVISESGEHTIVVKAIDKSGKETSKTFTYYVDVDGPEIIETSISPQTSEEAPSKSKTIEVSWDIEGDDLESIEITGGGIDFTATDVTATSQQLTFGEEVTSGKYTLTLKATDRNGNAAEEELEYYLDIDAPVFDAVSLTPETSETSPSGNKSPILSWDIDDTVLDSVSYSIDGTNYQELGNNKIGNVVLPSDIWTSQSGTFTIYVKASDSAGNESTVQEISYYLTESDEYLPQNLGVTESYGKRVLTWALEGYDEAEAVYDLHRSTDSVFEPSENTLLKSNIDAAKCLYIDNEILESGTYYYRIVVRDKNDTESEPLGVTEAVSVTNGITEVQYANTIGNKEYLSYLDVGLPIGNINVEESSGNLLYSQSDFALANAQLSYGLDRAYNSKVTRTSMFGTGWQDSYHKELYRAGNDIYFVDSDGSSYHFTFTDGSYVCDETTYYRLTATDSGYQIQTKDDQILSFNQDGQLTHITEANGCKVSFYYDMLGRMTHVVSKESMESEQHLELTYTDDGYLLEQVKDLGGTVYQYDYEDNYLTKLSIGEEGKVNEGVSYDYHYNQEGLLDSISDGMDYQYSVTYANGKAASVSYPDGEKYVLTYNAGETDIEKYTPSQQKIHKETLTFDTETGKILSYEDAKGNENTYQYVSGKPFLVASTTTVKAYQTIENDEIVFHESSDFVETEYEYDEDENIVSQTEYLTMDGTKLSSTYQYDSDGNLVSEKTEKSGETVTENTYEYDNNRNITKISDKVRANITQNMYDSDGNLILQELKEKGKKITETESTYDDQGNLINTSSSSGIVESEAEIQYDQMGRTTRTEEDGMVTIIEYDFLGRDIKTTIQEPGKTDIVETRTYDANGSLTSESSSVGTTVQYIYDNRNRLIKTTTMGEGIPTNVIENTYGYETNLMVHDGINGYTEEIVYKEETKDTAGTVTNITYTDALGQTVKEVSGTVFTDYVYDAAGNSVITYEGNTVNDEFMLYATLYDEEGRAFAELINPGVSNQKYCIDTDTVETYSEYDVNDNLSKETDALDHATTYTYDEDGELVTVDIADDGITDLTVSHTLMDDGGEITRVKDANGNVKEELFDASGLTEQTKDINGSHEGNESLITNYQYDSQGRVLKEIYNDNSYITYHYEGNSDRVLEKMEYLPDNTMESYTLYTYDMQSRLTGILHKEGDVTVSEYGYTYDLNGNVLTESVSYNSEPAKTTAYEYDAEGRMVKVTYPEDSGIGILTYEYDAFGNLLTIKRNNALVQENTYDAFSRSLTEKKYDQPGSNSYIQKSYVCDELGRIIEVNYTEDGDADQVLESYDYSYDKNDNIVSETRIANTPEEESQIHETRDYIYDSYARLIQSTITDHTAEDAQIVTTYEYDAVGNRIKQVEAGVETDYEYNGLNQLKKVETAETEIVYRYDARGNQVVEENTTTGETTETAYNVAGEMVSLVKKTGDTTTFTQSNVYNQDGSRISRTQGEATREYYYNRGVVAYTEDNNNLSFSNIQDDIGDVVGTCKDNIYYNYLTNVQGSTMSVLGQNGDTAAVYSYSDFGENEEVVEDTIGNEICYTGAIYDKDTGLYYMNARYYDAKNGRFISQDSYRGEIEDTGTWHLYAYCANDPVNRTDLSGHAWVKFDSIMKKKTKKAKLVQSRYQANINRDKEKIYKANKTSIISFQKNLKHIKYRSTNVAKCGCGIIAVHNLKYCYGKKGNFIKLVAEFDYNMNGNGPGIGINTVKKALDAYIPSSKVKSVSSFDSRLAKKKLGILLYMHSTNFHYIAVKKDGKTIRAYNIFSDTGDYTIKTSIEKFLKNKKYEYVNGLIIN